MRSRCSGHSTLFAGRSYCEIPDEIANRLNESGAGAQRLRLYVAKVPASFGLAIARRRRPKPGRTHLPARGRTQTSFRASEREDPRELRGTGRSSLWDRRGRNPAGRCRGCRRAVALSSPETQRRAPSLRRRQSRFRIPLDRPVRIAVDSAHKSSGKLS